MPRCAFGVCFHIPAFWSVWHYIFCCIFKVTLGSQGICCLSRGYFPCNASSLLFVYNTLNIAPPVKRTAISSAGKKATQNHVLHQRLVCDAVPVLLAD